MSSKPAGAPVWIELLSTEPDASAAFCATVLGVQVSEPKQEFGGYRDVLHDGRVVAGLLREKVKGRSGWRVWLRSDDLDATLAAVTGNGGTVVEGPEDVEGLGRRAVVRDPGGAETGVWELHGFPGMAVEGEPGAPCWYELHAAGRFDETVRFYRHAFGWDVLSGADGGVDAGRVVTFARQGVALAGILDSSVATAVGTEGDSRWQVYFQVENVDATIEAVAANGGTVFDGTAETPFGRAACLTDPTGAAFSVIRVDPDRH